MKASQWTRRPHFGRQDRRSEARDDCAGSAVVDVLAPQPRRAVPVDVIDVGGGGLKLKVPLFITPGSILRLHLTDAVAQAEVKYCSCEGAEFHVGVRIEEISSDPQQPVAGC